MTVEIFNKAFESPNPCGIRFGIDRLEGGPAPTIQVGSTDYGYTVYTLRYTTTNATPVDLPLIDLPAGSSCTIEVLVNSCDVFGSGLYTGGNAVGTFKSNGTATLVGTDYNKFGDADYVFAVSGSTGYLRLTGIIATNIIWNVAVRIMYNFAGP